LLNNIISIQLLTREITADKIYPAELLSYIYNQKKSHEFNQEKL